MGGKRNKEKRKNVAGLSRRKKVNTT